MIKEEKCRVWAYYPCVHLGWTEDKRGRVWTGDTLMFDVQTIYLTRNKVRAKAKIPYDISNGGSVDIEEGNILSFDWAIGLKDKNGKDVYENDFEKDRGEIRKVVFKDGCFQIEIYYFLESVYKKVGTQPICGYSVDRMNFCYNIHENMGLWNDRRS